MNFENRSRFLPVC
uniref:Uncharacterized protein n=1 Tax=Rhizophora mucronata TaxID=61149 RepID=A0A2P2M3Z8_RHIMU